MADTSMAKFLFEVKENGAEAGNVILKCLPFLPAGLEKNQKKVFLF